jgi:hypothetical protein
MTPKPNAAASKEGDGQQCDPLRIGIGRDDHRAHRAGEMQAAMEGRQAQHQYVPTGPPGGLADGKDCLVAPGKLGLRRGTGLAVDAETFAVEPGLGRGDARHIKGVRPGISGGADGGPEPELAPLGIDEIPDRAAVAQHRTGWTNRTVTGLPRHVLGLG